MIAHGQELEKNKVDTALFQTFVPNDRNI